MSNQHDAEWEAFEWVASVEWSHESYEFNMTAVYAEKATGKLYYAEDAGCSCPSPFEDTTVDELRPITRLQDWYDYVAERLEPSNTAAADEAESARRVIEQHLQANK